MQPLPSLVVVRGRVLLSIDMAGHFPDGPKTPPLIGALFAARRSLLDFFLDMATYGDLSSTMLGPLRMYLVNRPDLIEAVLLDHHRKVIKDNGTRLLSGLIGQGLVTSEGELWRKQRKLAAPPMQPKRIADYADTMLDCTQRMVRRFRDDEVRDLYADMTQLTFEIAGKTLLGVDPRRDAEPIARGLEALLHYFFCQLRTLEGGLPPSIDTPSRVRLRRARKDFDAVLCRIIRRCQDSDTEAEHLLARLVRARDDNGQPMPVEQVRDEAATMLLAGHETTALALTYTLYLLALHPEVTAAVRDELDRKLGGMPPTAADVTRLPYLTAVINESLRLFPPAFAIGREAIEKFELGGYAIAPGAQLILSPYVVQRDPRYFREPRRFLAERWLGSELDDLPRFAYFPFGGGPRICIGSHFAILETKLVLAVLLTQIDLCVLPGFRIELDPSVTLRPRHGLRMLVRWRRPARPKRATLRPSRPPGARLTRASDVPARTTRD